tara:strand:+ start:52 stop:339 length:288 start_codon:yes stop_codon:yes gene_type:complete
MILDTVPMPGISLSGTHKKRTRTPTINVERPTVNCVCSVIPCARTVQGLTPIPAPIKIASPVPKIHKPETSANSVERFGLKLKGCSELQTVFGTL